MARLDKDKPALRDLARKQRADFVASLPDSISHLAFSRIPAPLWRQLRDHDIFALYAPIGAEPRTTGYAQFLLEHGKQLALPRFAPQSGSEAAQREAAMTFAVWDGLDATLEKGPFGILQPKADAKPCEPNIFFVPLLAFDEALNRLGQGAGHYDRYFANRPDAIRIGLSWSVQQIEAIPIDQWDVPMHAIITQSEFLLPANDGPDI